MDPDITLAGIRELVKYLHRCPEPESGDVDRLVELVSALDDWISKGGFLPAARRSK